MASPLVLIEILSTLTTWNNYFLHDFVMGLKRKKKNSVFVLTTRNSRPTSSPPPPAPWHYKNVHGIYYAQTTNLTSTTPRI